MIRRNAVFLLLLALSTNTSAALTSAPIYAPCASTYTRTDVGTCTRSGSGLNALAESTCVSITVPKSRSITVRIKYTIKASAAVGNHALLVEYNNGADCSSPSDSRYLSTYEQSITVTNTVLSQDYYTVTAFTESNSVSLVWYPSVGTNFEVSYSLVEYKDR